MAVLIGNLLLVGVKRLYLCRLSNAFRYPLAFTIAVEGGKNAFEIWKVEINYELPLK